MEGLELTSYLSVQGASSSRVHHAIYPADRAVDIAVVLPHLAQARVVLKACLLHSPMLQLAVTFITSGGSNVTLGLAIVCQASVVFVLHRARHFLVEIPLLARVASAWLQCGLIFRFAAMFCSNKVLRQHVGEVTTANKWLLTHRRSDDRWCPIPVDLSPGHSCPISSDWRAQGTPQTYLGDT